MQITQQHRITEIIAPWIDAAIDASARGDKVMWESNLLPTQDGGAVFVVFVWMPAAVIGQQMQGSFAVNDPLSATAESITETVAEFLRQMGEARSQALAEAAQEPAQPVQPPVRGQQRPSGLLIP